MSTNSCGKREVGRVGPAKRRCHSPPPVVNVSEAGSTREVSSSKSAEGIVDASAPVGSSHEVAASLAIEHTQGVVEHAGLPREVASTSSGLAVEAVGSLTNNVSSQGLTQSARDSMLNTLIGESASCERLLRVPVAAATSSVDNLSDIVSPQGGAVDLTNSKPLVPDLAPVTPLSQVIQPEVLAQELLVAGDFSATAALKLVAPRLRFAACTRHRRITTCLWGILGDGKSLHVQEHFALSKFVQIPLCICTPHRTST